MSILSALPDGCGYFYAWYKDDHRQINVRHEADGWVAYVVGGEKVAVVASKDAAEAAALEWMKANPE